MSPVSPPSQAVTVANVLRGSLIMGRRHLVLAVLLAFVTFLVAYYRDLAEIAGQAADSVLGMGETEGMCRCVCTGWGSKC